MCKVLVSPKGRKDDLLTLDNQNSSLDMPGERMVDNRLHTCLSKGTHTHTQRNLSRCVQACP